MTHGAVPASTSEIAITPAATLAHASAAPTSPGAAAFFASRTSAPSDGGAELGAAASSGSTTSAPGAWRAAPLVTPLRSPRVRASIAGDGSRGVGMRCFAGSRDKWPRGASFSRQARSQK